MANVVLLYAEGEADRARAISDAAAAVRPLLSPVSGDARPMAFGPQVSVWMAWSRAAEQAGLARVFSKIAAGHTGALVVCACDDAQLPVELSARLVIRDLAHVRALDAAAAARFGLPGQQSPRAPKAPVDPVAARQASQAFAGGIFRGVAASVAFLGVGGAVALGAVDQLGAGESQHAAPIAPENMRVLDQAQATPQIDWGDEQTAFAPIDAMELSDAQTQLAAAAAQIESMRETAAPFVARLDQFARQDWRVNSAQQLGQVAEFSSPAPLESLPETQVATLDAAPSEIAPTMESEVASAADPLWSPEKRSPAA